jgi:uncharacterized protein (DUF169 family)
MLRRDKHPLEAYRQTGSSLRTELNLETDLVALKFIKKSSQISDGFVRPLRDLGRKMTICMAMAEARRKGTHWAITADDNPCTPASALHGWVTVPMWALVRSQVQNRWQKDALSMVRGSNKRYRLGGLAAQYPFNRILGHRGVLVAPLSDTSFVPDTVVVYAEPEQMTHIAQSLSFEGKHVPQAVLTGFAESCFAAGLIPSRSRKPVLVLLGTGDRALGRAKSSEVAMGMPGSMVFCLKENLYKSGGEHNHKHLLEHPGSLNELDESMLPGWTSVRQLIQKGS